MEEDYDIEKAKKVDLIELIRTFKHEGIKNFVVLRKEKFEHLLQAYKEQEQQINKLKNKNNELLKKLRNRVKQVNKLTKYSNYKKEFTTLNKRIKEQEKVIDEMGKELEERSRFKTKEEWKQYFINKVKENKE